MEQEQKDYILSCDYELLAYEFRAESNIIKQIIEDFNLFEIENSMFFSELVCEKMEELEKKKEQKAKAGIASGMARRRAKKGIEQRSNSVRTEHEQVDEQKRTKEKRNNIEIEEKELKEILDFYNQTFNKNLKSSVSWQNNLSFWLQTYSLDDIKQAIKNLDNPS